ncbi:protein EARLY-RESPONSIVE TO DEHYDRATION 7, chloroplastic-like [Salvia splendens]|uniref:protein EARLY-RESPONSIVE TO DEHYDRATION 7, chloroplastic-like n=1 Tax=Salvia splendens TaxID=180675 RepID=UPI001C251766|nr:protein EARLY-RESPONSIVE TO DEHYDRATION 7, chloroplastic-like [Salvia splendens]
MSSSRSSLYPQVDQTNPESNSQFTPKNSSSSMYPTIQMNELAENLFPDTDDEKAAPAEFDSFEQVLVTIPGSIVHLIDKERSVELASGDFSVVQLLQGGNAVAALARVGEQIQWPLARDEAAVKLDDSHYFFSLRVPAAANDGEGGGGEDLLNYGLTIAAKGQEDKVRELDGVLEKFSAFKVEKAAAVVEQGWWGAVAREVSPEEMKGEKKEEVEKSAAAYWTTLAPNVEEYSGSVAKLIAAGSGQLVRGILWCGDVTVDRLKWGNEFLTKRMGKGSSSEISPQALRRLKRVKQMTKMSEKVATGLLSGVVKVSGFFTSSVVNSAVGKKFFSLLPGEIILASLDGFNKVFDAVEVSGKNVMSTTSVVTTKLVSQKYGEQAAEATHDGLGAAGHAIGTAWTVFKLRKALNPKSALKPTAFVKAAAAEANAAKLKDKQKK